MRWVVPILVVVAGCVSSDVVDCGDFVCPAETQCASVSQPPGVDGTIQFCVQPEQDTACDGLEDGASCTTPTIETGGVCQSGYCLLVECGNHLTQPGEQCDDGNQFTGDGCAGDCRSNEICGNGETDGFRGEQCDDGNLTSHDGCTSTCKNESAVWFLAEDDRIYFQEPFRTGPISDAAMAYDEARGVVVLFGGDTSDTPLYGYFGDTWLWNGGWVKARPFVSPSGRGGAAMAYDANRKVVVLFGGETNGAGNANDTWEWDGTTWTLRSTGVAPSPRRNAVMVYDSKRKRMILFGGTDFYNTQDDTTWSWDGNQWSRLTTAVKPEWRARTAMVYDPKRDRVVLYGGTNLSTQFTSTWEFDGTTWLNRNATPPNPTGSPLSGSLALAWDATSDRVIMFGGKDAALSTTVYNTTFAWNGSTWTRLGDGIGARRMHSMASDTTRKRVVVWGGLNVQVTAPRVDEWNGTSWSTVAYPGRNGQPTQIATDIHRGRAVSYANDGSTMEYDGHAWKVISSSIPSARDGTAVAYDIARRETVLFGGRVTSGSLLHGETWRYNGAWTIASVTGPSARQRAALAYDAERQRSVLFGGAGTAGALADTWLWDGTAWQQATPPMSPTARSEAGVAYDPDREQVVLFGGKDSASAYDGETWTWNGTTWTRHTLAVSPVARSSPSMAWDATRRKVVLFAGEGADGALQDTWEWDGEKWAVVNATEPPVPRYEGAMFSDPRGAGVVVYAGFARPGTPLFDISVLRWQGVSVDESCRGATEDLDGDGRTSCADEDCWAFCQPECPPGTSCAMSACGDGMCAANLETCRLCPADCGACTPVCGDFHCDPNEVCPGDCP